jgi:hypothetical protein
MPGNVQNASFNGVLPWSLSTSFTEVREWPALVSGDYKDGSSQRQEQAESSRKSYQLGKRLTPAAMDTLRAFYLANVGRAFKVYTKKSDYDDANANFKLMRFEGGWNEEYGLGRSNISLQLVEVA